MSAQRPGQPSTTWRTKVHRKRDNQSAHWSSGELELLLWRHGFGPVASAAMLDWWCSSHPDTIAAQSSEPQKETTG